MRTRIKHPHTYETNTAYSRTLRIFAVRLIQLNSYMSEPLARVSERELVESAPTLPCRCERDCECEHE